MNKLISAALLCLAFTLSAAAQSGIGGLRGFVTDSRRGASAAEGASVELRSIENHSGTEVLEKATTDKNGEYKIWVSFGYYTLTISKKGYQTYQTKIYIPSSVELRWGTLLEKEPAEKPKK